MAQKLSPEVGALVCASLLGLLRFHERIFFMFARHTDSPFFVDHRAGRGQVSPNGRGVQFPVQVQGWFVDALSKPKGACNNVRRIATGRLHYTDNKHWKNHLKWDQKEVRCRTNYFDN